MQANPEIRLGRVEMSLETYPGTGGGAGLSFLHYGASFEIVRRSRVSIDANVPARFRPLPEDQNFARETVGVRRRGRRAIQAFSACRGGEGTTFSGAYGRAECAWLHSAPILYNK